MVMSKNYFCYSELLGAPKCFKSPFDLYQSFVDFPNSRVFLLTTTHILMIKHFVKDPTNLQVLFFNEEIMSEISDVSEFAVFDNNLYFLCQGQLMFRNLTQKTVDVLLIKNFTFNRLTLHRESFTDYKYCESLKCPFFCQASLTNEVTCGCPSPTVRVDNKCICPQDHPYCTLPQCAGFKCRNSKCLLDNVRCNGVNDCGDNSDEIDCKSNGILTQKNVHPIAIYAGIIASKKNQFVKADLI
ncbi:Low-density lipoprotein receptor-related protein 4 [Thelohanellus kitauei]|uniref:Low-density lipoprotein receptor-related protein 4 n=1 Tax=Thelohanellus kitauei TaxID=669202 RepID=A0A0C2MBF5_THEKT|nr:Low-density lipoprotein receptor-related protein 4 [Thelohanellus kitauei]